MLFWLEHRVPVSLSTECSTWIEAVRGLLGVIVGVGNLIFLLCEGGGCFGGLELLGSSVCRECIHYGLESVEIKWFLAKNGCEVLA